MFGGLRFLECGQPLRRSVVSVPQNHSLGDKRGHSPAQVAWSPARATRRARAAHPGRPAPPCSAARRAAEVRHGVRGDLRSRMRRHGLARRRGRRRRRRRRQAQRSHRRRGVRHDHPVVLLVGHGAQGACNCGGRLKRTVSGPSPPLLPVCRLAPPPLRQCARAHAHAQLPRALQLSNAQKKCRATPGWEHARRSPQGSSCAPDVGASTDTARAYGSRP